MLKRIHPIAGALAMLIIAIFWFSTVISEVFGSPEEIITVKTAIPWGFLALIPALATAGGTGFKLSKGRRAGLMGKKLKRMPFIAVNGLVVLIPAAFFLSFKAQAGEFDTVFYVVQVIELIAGAVNLFLLGMNMRDGLQMKGRLRSNRH